ncbi:MAG TPA: FeoA domain-containing protein [Pirellulales bacterium]|jgi:Fe2+ transport system protein FeoA|nr:FeoA domain-containing protein [Pirellulales bacterium]
MSLNKNTAAASLTHRLMPLGRVSAGQRASVAQVVGRSDQVQRLKELGFQHGAALEMVSAGSPCIVRLQGNKLCIRGNELLNVLVECED